MPLHEWPLWLATLTLGVGATALMDLSAVTLQRTAAIPAPDWALIGRWVAYWPSGVFHHPSIAQAYPKTGERPLGWLTHYLVGLLLAGSFVAVVGRDWLANPEPRTAVGWGLTTVLLPYLILQPALGAGLAARHSPKPANARLRSLFNHGIFGFGLYLRAALLQGVAP